MNQVEATEKQAIIEELSNTFNELSQALSLFKESEIDVVPFEGSWTAGEVAEHVTKSLQGLSAIANGRTATPDRAHDEKCIAIRNLFLDFKAKFNSPESVLPTAQQHDRNEMLKTFAAFKEQMLAAAETLNLSMLFTDFEFPSFGYLTLLEWFTFYAVHTQRHARQLKNIHKALINDRQ
ncbi:MAG: DinB family protein [Bacteroidetes bacterium]|nr:DinB family protein [Bacteroidota bacterium]